ncbi:MAG: ParB/RepB/Spo0J family partition protein [Kiritimatiellaeota bacterium]|nr:ParB/RepB/Spo0J family partition protein [Kiritimatiellota bacterium]
MAAKHIGLGRGLGALIKDTPADTPPAAAAPPAEPDGERVLRVGVDRIHQSRWQPRQRFAPEAIEELAQSIREKGVLQPLTVRRTGETYELIAGERRWRAAQAAGLKDVPVLVMTASDQQALEMALVENLQREDLNVMEEAEGYRLLAEKFALTQEQIAARVGKARATVANALRLLELPEPVRQMVSAGQLSPGHAKVLLGLEIPREQELLAERVLKEGLSVRTLERIVNRLRRAPRKPRAEKAGLPADYLRDLTDRLHRHFGAGVRITPCKTLSNGKQVKGCVEVDFYSNEDLDRLLTLFGLPDAL